jgi:hypothetical protein
MKFGDSVEKSRNLQRKGIGGVISMYKMQTPAQKLKMMNGTPSRVMDPAGQNIVSDEAEFPAPADEPTDDRLLNKYCTKRDEAAFVAAVRLGHEIAQQISRRRLLRHGAAIVAGTRRSTFLLHFQTVEAVSRVGTNTSA